jgi:hypothetical protein
MERVMPGVSSVICSQPTTWRSMSRIWVGSSPAGQGLGDGAVDQLEVAAAGELLELHQGEVGLDAGGVAVHEQADGARGRQHRDLGVAEAPLLAVARAVSQLSRAASMMRLGTPVPCRPWGRMESCSYSERRGVVGGAAVVADDPQHGSAFLA